MDTLESKLDFYADFFSPQLFRFYAPVFRALLVLSLLEVTVSICTFVLIWKARGSTEATVSVDLFLIIEVNRKACVQ